MKRVIYKLYAPIILTGFVAVTVWFLTGARGKDELSLFLTIVGGLVSFFYFIQKQQLEELELFKELFADFNARYDRLNESLNKIYLGDSKQPLTHEETSTLNDYFNLCAEEYLYYRKGYIYEEVWRAWRNGMGFYLSHKRIRDKWTEEEKYDSYYGLKMR
jgi:hypothetical protein